MIRATARLVRALTALAALTALLAGMPVLLLRIAPVHLPSNWPQWDDVRDALTRPDDGHLFLLALSLIAWGGWALFALSTLLEAAGRIRGVPTLRLPGLAAPQKLAAALLTSTAVVLSSAATATTPALPPRPPVAAALVGITPHLVADHVTPVSGHAQGQDEAGVTTVRDNLPRVTVRRGDTLWGLAERHLGHGPRYREIADLNYGRRQPDGRTLTDSHWLRPGWTLLLPSDADVRAPFGDRVAATHTVRPHDTLTKIAAEQLGDGGRYTEIYALNRHQPQADGGTLTDPDTIRPGWILQLPARTSATSTPPEATSTGPAPDPSPTQTPTPTPTVLPSPGGATSPPSTATAAPAPAEPTRPSTPSPATAAAEATSSASESSAASPTHRADDAGIHLPGGFLPWPLAGAITAAAAMVWLRRRHRPTRDGDDFALPDVVETVVRDTRRHPRTKPPTELAARAAAVPPQQQPPPGGTGLVGPGAPSAARAALVAALASGGPHQPDHRAEVVTGRTTLTGLLGEKATTFTDWPRLRIAESSECALDVVEEHLLHRARVLDDNLAADVDVLRDQTPDEEPIPTLVLVLDVADSGLVQRIDTVLRLGVGKNVTGLLLGPYPDGPTLRVTTDGHVQGHRVGDHNLDAASHRDPHDSGSSTPDSDADRIAVLDADTAITMLQTLHEAHTGRRGEPTSRMPTATTTRKSASAAPSPTPPPADGGSSSPDGGRARLRVFGDPTILDVEPGGRPLRSKARELAVFLACHREGADTRTLGEHLAPDSRLRQADQSIHTLVSNLRYVLGRAADGRRDAYVIKIAGRYHLDPATVDVDLWTMEDLLAQAATAPDPPSRVPLLRDACAQYTGPLAGARDYDWIGPYREAARRTAVEAHRQLAEALLDSQPRAAADVLDAAITIDPYNEDLYRTAMRARHQAADHDGLCRLRRALTTALHDLDTEPGDETLELADQLTSDTSPRHGPDVAGRKSAGATPLADAR